MMKTAVIMIFVCVMIIPPGGMGGAEPPGAIVTRGRIGGPVLMAGIYVSRTDSYDVTYRNRVRVVCNRVRLVCNLRHIG